MLQKSNIVEHKYQCSVCVCVRANVNAKDNDLAILYLYNFTVFQIHKKSKIKQQKTGNTIMSWILNTVELSAKVAQDILITNL